MTWRTKARIQNVLAWLPSEMSYAFYYRIQRRFGGLRRVDPTKRLAAAAEVSRRLDGVGRSLSESTVLEVGTGRRLNTPIGLWLAGAERVITVDLNPYLKEELVHEDIEYIAAHPDAVAELFAGTAERGRLDELLSFARGDWRLADLMDFCNIEYLAPADATDLPLAAGTVDCHCSFTVLEHVPGPALTAIFEEGNRVVRGGGVFVHRIDYSDHFAHSDPSISRVNFLQFEDREWDRLAGNRYMYMNRLRHDDFRRILEAAGHSILEVSADVDAELVDLLDSDGLTLASPFRDKSREVLATTGAWVVSEHEDLGRTVP